MNAIKKFIDGQDGVTSIEYALIAMLVGLAIVSAVGNLGANVFSLYQKVINVFP